ncbi:MAG: TetR/AcrR family transcriptional regulator C-terminal domain-containing protein [Gemmatimonadaceae bacterium]
MSPAAPSENREARRAEIVGAALRLLEEAGLDRLSLRGVARELGMHAPGLYWYIESRQELIDLLAKAVLDEAVTGLAAPAPGQTWDEWLTDFALRMRRALLAHRDGARVVAGAFLFRANSITAFLELALETMERDGFSRDFAMLGAVTVMRYTLGIALDDQESPTKEPEVRKRMLEQALAKGPPIDAERWPRVADVMSRWFQKVKDTRGSGEHGELHFRHGLGLVIAGIRSTKGKEIGEG